LPFIKQDKGRSSQLKLVSAQTIKIVPKQPDDNKQLQATTTSDLSKALTEEQEKVAKNFDN